MVTFNGPIDSAMDDRLAENVLAVLQELVSNVARHAEATHVDVARRRSQTGSSSCPSPTTDAVSPKGRPAGGGWTTSGRRATRLGAEVEWQPGPDGGTVATFSVKLQ